MLVDNGEKIKIHYRRYIRVWKNGSKEGEMDILYDQNWENSPFIPYSKLLFHVTRQYFYVTKLPWR